MSSARAEMILVDIASRGAALYSSRRAVTDGDRTLTYDELYVGARRQRPRSPRPGSG